MVGNLLATPLEFGTVFRNTTWASLDQESFVVLASTGGHRRIGRPKYCWDILTTIFCLLKNLPSWEIAAIDVALCRASLP